MAGELEERGGAVEVEVRRSARRRRTVSAYRDGDRLVLMIPAAMSRADERYWVQRMRDRVAASERRTRPSEEQLFKRALALDEEYFGGLATPDSVVWARQRSRWGSCSPHERAIRISTRLRGMPSWVIDYVLVHELAHLLEPGHGEAFWGWVNRYPLTERARGFLAGWAAAAERRSGEDSDHVD